MIEISADSILFREKTINKYNKYRLWSLLYGNRQNHNVCAASWVLMYVK